MARWSVVNGDAEMTISVTPDGRVQFEVTPPGTFVVDTDTAQDIRIKIGAAIGIAHEVAGTGNTRAPAIDVA